MFSCVKLLSNEHTVWLALQGIKVPNKIKERRNTMKRLTLRIEDVFMTYRYTYPVTYSNYDLVKGVSVCDTIHWRYSRFYILLVSITLSFWDEMLLLSTVEFETWTKSVEPISLKYYWPVLIYWHDQVEIHATHYIPFILSTVDNLSLETQYK